MTAINFPSQFSVNDRRKTVITSGQPRGFEIGSRRNWPAAVEIYKTLWGFFPDNLEYGLRLAAAHLAPPGGLPELLTAKGYKVTRVR